ncbi:uncharacterized protein EKO05_0001817 [Ascochyta rabiei]|uniref:uncharacterized protein n=1 Tax=Didymella rabiei TaxID=5454 RepID=UPI001900ED59|nr:uncharacterized protein EKO05_0001817 [Ascochyta rabiei]UPX11197.1 hypothetical protein EKO05_0001817 [Ascochyta rabiei]
MHEDPDQAGARRRARRLVNNIAQEHTLNGTIFGTPLELLVNNCLEILSKQLYEKNTHFLLELIQNADDNTYACATPTLSFTYKPGCLRIDCNEVGFDASNVTAICGISQSTKSNKTSDGEFIGEKGIGFKSVFKAADTVQIVSNEFTFKFDRTKPLGVITPLWEECPEQTDSQGTSIILQLATAYNEQTLIKELREFDTNLLVFLRRVEKINIEVECADSDAWKKQIRKTQYEQDYDRIVLLQTGADSLRFLTRTHVVTSVPQEAKRKNWTETKITIAFPLPSEEGKPALKPHHVYAFLPIRSYGFRFLIQADFILTASREDIESTLPWNVSIRDALSEAFVSSMLHFNQGALKYVWPFYLPSLSTAISGFFEPAIKMILSRVEESPLIESCVGNMVRPSTLAHVPAEFCTDGRPYTLCTSTEDRYLSFRYASWVVEAMECVGVSQMTPFQFLGDLATLLATDAESFRKRGSEWQAQLAITLLKLSTDAELMPLIRSLTIIPLNDGTWITACDNNIFFSQSDTLLAIPDGLRVLIVDCDAEADPNRRSLFASLGVKEWSASEICRLILDLHASADFQQQRLNTKQLVSHATFLYQAKWQPPKGANLWFATTKTESFCGREVYVSGRSNADSAVARVFATLEKHFPVMHTDYLTALPGEPEYIDWLIQNLGLSKIPRLVTPVVEPKPQPIETPFMTLTDNLSHNQVDSLASDTQACDIDITPPNAKHGSIAQTLEHSLIAVHTRRASVKAWPLLAGRSPGSSNNKPVLRERCIPRPREPTMRPISEATVQGDSSKPFPPFDNTAIQEIPQSAIRWPAAVRFQLATGVCDQCQMREGIWKCDDRHYHLRYHYFHRWLDWVRRKVTKKSGYREVATEQSNDLAAEPPSAIAALSMNKDVKVPEQLAEPSHEPKKLLFSLSEEFICMLRDCESMDVLQLFRDNWHYYSQWIEGAHLEWQSGEYVVASTHLKYQVGASLVRTSRGSLPLHDTVLAKLDVQLDQSRFVPALYIQQPEDTEWHILTYFGVGVKSDVHYYLRCMTTLSRDEAPDIDVVSYIYEQIQSRYTGNEELIRAAFYSKEIIFLPVVTQVSNSQVCWANMGTCISQGIDVTSVYTNCSYLFRCLYSPSGDPVAGLVHAITMISSFSSLEDIARLFRELSRLLKGVNSSKLSLLLKPLQNKAIIPVVDGFQKTGYDRLVSVYDTAWFIADHANLVASFTGVVPLLAFLTQDLPAIEDLLRALRLEGRKISKSSRSQTRVAGQTRLDARYAENFRLKIPFIKALVPRNHPFEVTLRHQIAQLRVRIAASVLHTFTIVLPNKEVTGKPVSGNVCITLTDSSMILVMTDQTAKAAYPSHELVSKLAQTCGIEEQNHITLLLVALANSSLKSINAAYLQQGIEVEGLLLDDSEDEFDAEERPNYPLGVDGAHMPSLSTEDTEHGSGGGLALPEGFKFGAQRSERDIQDQDLDRRIPMIPRIKGAGNTYLKIRLSELERKEDEFVENDHVQFLGENMVARLLSVHLGSSFDPVRDWTSDLRERAGFTYVPEDASIAPFTLTQAETIRAMTEFAVQYGVSWRDGWQKRLRTSSPIYHVDVLISGDSTGKFVMEAKWLERAMRLRLPSCQTDEIFHVNVLMHVTQAYSEADFSISMIVDPWHLIYSGKLKFTKNWLMQGLLSGEKGDPGDDAFQREGVDAPLTPEVVAVSDRDKQLVLYTNIEQKSSPSAVGVNDDSKTQALGTLYLPWTQAEAAGMLRSRDQTLHVNGRRKLYSYKPLLHGYIRLLYLLPGNREGCLQAVLNHIACNYAGTYQALSYVWGGDVRDRELLTPDGVIPITTSLYKALLALRQTDQGIMIWVDAVCINQTDTKEKAQQIRLMPEIYQACECAYAFLSEGSPATDQALEMLMQLRARTAQEKQQQSSKNIADGNDSPRMMSMWGGDRLPPLNSPIWESVETLFTLPYFRRAWIIQEVVAAPNVKFACGEWLIDWKDLCAAQEILDREVHMAEYEERLSNVRASWEPFKKLAVQREWELRQHRWILLTLLEHFRHADSTLRRDRLFSLVGLASDGNEVEFEPDYDSNFHDIVLRFAQAFVRQGRGIQLLYRAGISCDEHGDKHPSWIPDWTLQRPIGLHDSTNTDLIFSACGLQPQHVTLGPGPEELSIDGYDMDIILTITAASNTEREWSTYFAEVDAMIDESVLSDAMDPKKALKWKVPIAAAPFASAASYSAFRKHLTNPNHVPTSGRYGLELDVHQTYAECLRGTLSGWKFVITKRGFAGVVPPLSQVGDNVAIMKGGCVPFVLRESGEKWRLVGECYVHGIMKGEGLWLPGVTERTFCVY